MERRPRFASLFASIATLVATLVLVSAEPPSRAQGNQAKPLPYLLDVGDLRALVRYSPGALDRASHVQFRFALLAEDFAKWYGEAVPLSVVLLSRTDWEALELAVPYGLPARLLNGEIALSAWGDQRTVLFWQQLLGGGLPQIEGHPLHGSKAEASSLLLADLLAQGVAARALLERAGYSGANPDVLNLAAHVVALAASHRHEPLSLGDIRRVYSIEADPDPTGEPTWRSRLATEGAYYRAADALISKRGSGKAAKSILKLLRKNPASLTPRQIADRFPEVRGILPGA
ncbi:MAG: hypothetical protein ACE5GX_01125 [Thermoanaerobaculia bacterium]